MRITGGQYRSRALRAPGGTATRPTSDRVREALFSILGDDCAGARVLDLYAGTGALGLEALSRGAAFVVFVERSKEALAALRANVGALGVEGRARVVPLPVERAARGLCDAPDERFDLVFADPPYAGVKSGAAVRAIASCLALPGAPAKSPPAPVLGTGGKLVLEHAQRDASPAIDGMRLESTRAYGDTALSFYVALP